MGKVLKITLDLHLHVLLVSSNNPQKKGVPLNGSLHKTTTQRMPGGRLRQLARSAAPRAVGVSDADDSRGWGEELHEVCIENVSVHLYLVEVLVHVIYIY